MTEDVKDQQPDELELLKERAKQLGIKFHWNIGIDKLRAQVNEAIAPKKSEPIQEEKTVIPTSKRSGNDGLASQMRVTLLNRPDLLSAKERASRLVRVIVSCRNPNKQEWEGEIFTVGNRHFGFKKYVPFNNEEGWHIPHMLYEHLIARQCQIFVNQKDDRGNKIRKGRMINEFNVTLLDDLTNVELKDLGQRQAMAEGTHIN